MSVDEVLGVLRQNGEIQVDKAEWPGGIIQLQIDFTDSRGQALYGAFDLGFSFYKYNRASTGGNIDLGPRAESICYLGQVIPPDGETPVKP